MTIQLGLVIGQLTSGGAEGQLWQLCRGVATDPAVAPTVYCLSEEAAPYRERIETLGVPVRVIAGARANRVWRLRRALVSDGIEVVHAWLFIANAYAWLATRGTAMPLLTSARNCKQQGRVLDALNRYAFRASSAIVANSQQVRAYIERVYQAPSARIAVIPNAIDTERFHPAAPRPRATMCIAMVGRLVPQKNPLLFVAAAAELHRRLPATRFMLIGDGPLRAQVADRVAAAGLDGCFTITGERHDVPDLLRAADVFWLTSDWEGLPNVVMEAMATGLPVVVTDVGGARELVRSDAEGFVIPAGDQGALVDRSVALLTDPELRVRMSAAARTRSEAFAPGHMVAAMTGLYRGAVEERRR